MSKTGKLKVRFENMTTGSTDCFVRELPALPQVGDFIWRNNLCYSVREIHWHADDLDEPTATHVRIRYR